MDGCEDRAMAKPSLILLLSLVLAAAAFIGGCGDDDSSSDSAATTPAEAVGDAEGDAMKKEDDAMKKESDAMAKEGDAMKKEGEAMTGGTVTIEAADSEFGEILVDSNDQAIYIFENDSKNKTVCYGECAKAWPPVLAKSTAAAGAGVDESLLGMVERRDGDRQVTYAGQPLYYYAHEDPGQVLCHNVDLNGGFWWVLGPDGERRP
jgi:predicted lipoprotein with Yx(FWY)xxD motif